MTFIGLICTTCLHRRLRAAVTSIAVAIGVTAVLALGVLTSSLRRRPSPRVRADPAERGDRRPSAPYRDRQSETCPGAIGKRLRPRRPEPRAHNGSQRRWIDPGALHRCDRGDEHVVAFILRTLERVRHSPSRRMDPTTDVPAGARGGPDRQPDRRGSQHRDRNRRRAALTHVHALVGQHGRTDLVRGSEERLTPR